MQLRLRASVVLVAIFVAVPTVLATGVTPAAADTVPQLDSVTPNHAYIGYSYPITIVGTHLTGATSVDFNAPNHRVADSFVVVNDSTMTAMTPELGAFSSGTTLSVTTPSGTSNGLPFTWTFTEPPPDVTAITPASGSLDGGERIAITGNYVNSGTSVTFDGIPATIAGGNGPGEIDVDAPAHAAGFVDVVVTTGGGSGTSTNGYSYLNVPAVTAVSPSSGHAGGGTQVTITGTDLIGTSAVTFGGSPAPSFTVNSGTSITATSPAHEPGVVVDVTVTSPGGSSSSSSADEFTFGRLPAIIALSPNHGMVAGGESVTITGTDFAGASAVKFGTTPAPSFTVDSSTSITATTPAHPSSDVEVSVVSPLGTSSGTSADDFTYADPDPSPTPEPNPVPSPRPSTCCRMVTGAGAVFASGGARVYGDLRGRQLRAPVVGIASTPSGRGYWLVAADGGVFAFGDASFFGSRSGRDLRRPIVGIGASVDGGGYWLVAADGGVFAFGDARFAGSMAGRHLNVPIVGIAANATGYRVVAADGGVFTFGGVDFLGSMAGAHLAKPIVGIVATSRGYLLVGIDGGVFAFGNARMLGSMAGGTRDADVIGVVVAGRGYLLATRNGTCYSFTESAHGVERATAVDAPIVGIG